MVQRRCPECDRLEINSDAKHVLLSRAVRTLAGADRHLYEGAQVALSDAQVELEQALASMQQHRQRCVFRINSAIGNSC